MDAIKNQVIFLLGSFLSGVAVMLAYEIINIIRGLFRPGIVGRLFLDVIFFTVSGICVFQMIFLCNNGTIRSFFVFAFGAGAVLFRKTFGTRISSLCVRAVQKTFRLLTRPLLFLCKQFTKIIKKREKNS